MFRVSKRRKVLRKPNQHLDQDDTEVQSIPTVEPSPPPDAPSATENLLGPRALNDVEQETTSVADVLRRKLARSRKLGVGFSNLSIGPQHSVEDAGDSMSHSNAPDEESRLLEAAVNRFAPQTGQVTDVLDKHM
jgi:hypothetical protein